MVKDLVELSKLALNFWLSVSNLLISHTNSPPCFDPLTRIILWSPALPLYGNYCTKLVCWSDDIIFNQSTCPTTKLMIWKLIQFNNYVDFHNCDYNNRKTTINSRVMVVNLKRRKKKALMMKDLVTLLQLGLDFDCTINHRAQMIMIVDKIGCFQSSFDTIPKRKHSNLISCLDVLAKLLKYSQRWS